MLDSETIKDFQWKTPQNSSHVYILKTIKRILATFSFDKKTKIIDAGCGGGYLTYMLYKSGYENILGFDISESAIAVARANFKEIESRFHLHNAYEASLPSPLAAGGYELAICAEVIEHLCDPAIYLRNINNWLERGGCLIVTTPYHGFLKNLLIVLTNKFDKHFNPLEKTGHIKFFTKDTIYRILRETGFEPIKLYGLGGVPYLWHSMAIAAKKL